MATNKEVRSFWEREPCGTGVSITKNIEPESREWFEQIEAHRYNVEPYIHSIAQFTRFHGKKLQEVGVGAGTDHLQWARAGAECHGVDLTEAAIETTRKHLALYGLTSNLQRVDAERLPFEDNSFDVVYSWGVIHHEEHPEKIIAKILRVLKPGSTFIGMVYGLYSPTIVKAWVKHGLLKGRPWRSFRDITWNHVESVGTKAYTSPQVRTLFGGFGKLSLRRMITIYDPDKWPKWISSCFPDNWGWFIALRAQK